MISIVKTVLLLRKALHRSQVVEKWIKSTNSELQSYNSWMKFKRSKFNHQIRKIVVSCDPRSIWPSFKPWNQLVRRDASTSLTSFAISRVRTKGIMSTFCRPISPRTIFTAWCSDQRPNFSGINLGVCHGIRWNMMELYFGGGYMRLPTRIRWKNMEKQQTLQGLSGAST